jgi:hypothetical protein
MQAVHDVCDSYRNFMPLKILVTVCDLEMHLSFDEQQSFGRYLASHEVLSQIEFWWQSLSSQTL